jgi:glycosyltransferase involved in cell wall biosynthesis
VVHAVVYATAHAECETGALLEQVLPTVSIIIPTINEEEGIALTLSELPLKDLNKYGCKSEIIIVDGGSTDKTKKKAEHLGAKVISESRKGYGRAYKTGFLASRGKFLFTLDGDHTYPSAIIPTLLNMMITQGLDFITTNRLKMLDDGSMDSIHKLGNWVLKTAVNILFSVKLNDSQSGMWVIKRDVVKHIFPISDGMPFSQEIKIRAFRCCKCREISIPYRKRIGNRKLRTLSHGIQNLLQLFLLRISLAIHE